MIFVIFEKEFFFKVKLKLCDHVSDIGNVTFLLHM